MMHRSIGKRIRMDDPPPMDYDIPETPGSSIHPSPMTPSRSDYQEHYNPYANYHNVQTPRSEVFGLEQYHEPAENNYDQSQILHQPQSIMTYGASHSPSIHDELNIQHQMPVHDAMSNLQLENQIPSTSGNDDQIGNVRMTRARTRGVTYPPQRNVTLSPSPPPEKKPEKRRPGRPPGRPPGSKKQVVQVPLVDIQLENDGTLYGTIRNGRVSLQVVVDDWIEQYKINKDEALLVLMQFFINAAGCKGVITSSMTENMEHAAIIRKMTEEFDEESGEYPLIMSGIQWKKFRSNFCDFVAQLVKQCQYSIIYDQYLMDNMISLLTGLSDSQVRAFRHTATLAAMKLMTALVDVALIVSVNLDNTQRQYEAERQKARDKRASDRLETLMSKRQELEENMDEIKNMLTYMFKSVFVHRYRDTLPEIRAICMAEIGVWMKKFHQNFLDDSYLKYIGWTLHDKVGEVRLKCLQALQPLYASEELKSKLELFTSKFKDRIVAMTLDKEYDVAVQAVRLVISILKHHRDILSDKDCEHVYELVYSSHRAVAQAAGEFLNERLFKPEEDMKTIRTKRGKKRLPNTPLIRDLVQFFIESELHEHGAYLVDSLIDSNEMMKDWECMTDLLLEEPGLNEERMDDRQETSLIELMVCCIKQAATGEAPVGRGPNRKMMSVKEVKTVQDDKQRLTEHFIKVLPPLIDKYRADADKLINLLSIPQYFDLDIYTTSRQESNLDLLLKKIHLVTDKHQNDEVLETCAKTLEILCSKNNSTLATRCSVQKSTLMDTITNKHREAMDDWNNLIEGNEKPDDDEIYNVVNSMKKLSIFYSCHNLGPWNLWDIIFKDLKMAHEGTKPLPEEAIKYSISACMFATMWDLHSIESVIENGRNENIEDQVMQVKNKLYEFMDVLRGILAHSTNPQFKEEAYISICDLLVVFCNQLGVKNNSMLGSLVYDSDKELQDLLNNFIQKNVFVYEEEGAQDEHSKIEELHKRRNFLASYCKLIVYGMIPVTCAADIFKHYVKSYNEYGDIIKTTIGKAREINKVICARTMVVSLITSFKELQMTCGTFRISRTSQEFSSLKELAKRFALSFGLDALKNREAMAALHREGVLFAVGTDEGIVQEDPSVPPPHVAFLEILAEFTNKLLKQDKRIVLNYLDKHITSAVPSSRSEDWQPWVIYRNSLMHGDAEPGPVTSRRAYTRRNKKETYDDDDEEGSDQEFGSPPVVQNETPVKKKKSKITKSITFQDSLDIQPSDTSSWSDSTTIGGSRPTRQCINRSIPYRYIQDDDEEDE
ncbi:cohesin subunit SA-2 isoform X1 [Daktulosphaira vitifoliae]|uniref:cohesin subunit SA-2 isoform X1 n=1 Tax=Daktulosphaira vitifoliae TaxID=58002 RepID=UPI0021AAD260|nr:cohesin subunit SA-2 isoform X1 [Daktulosphaira vitifoliae]